MKEKISECPICACKLQYQKLTSERDLVKLNKAYCCGLVFYDNEKNVSFITKDIGAHTIMWNYVGKVCIFKGTMIICKIEKDLPYTIGRESLEKLLVLI